MVQLELVYIPAEGATIHLHLTVAPGSTVADVLALSGLAATNPEIQGLSVGLFSKQVPLDSLVKPGDRLEIYRALTLDPKEKRRQRAKRNYSC